VKELSPGPFIESDDPAIARRAVRLARAERDPSVIARRIVEWVHDSVRAEAPTAPQTASATLAQRRGDSREFALLTTAIARAAGVPAQTVTGLLHHDGRFFLHAWTEVYLGRWIPVDAMLGQFPADAAHIPFLTGAADPGPDLARVLSRLELSVTQTVRAR
jgi:transglutaminase-like putative cysteine protease